MIFVYPTHQSIRFRDLLQGGLMSTTAQRRAMHGGGSSFDDAFGDDRQVTNYRTGRGEPGLPSSSAKRLANGLGWFSIGLGLAELLAPRAIASISGVSKE